MSPPATRLRGVCGGVGDSSNYQHEARDALVFTSGDRVQLLSCVPVWTLGMETPYPGLHYVVFPANVGGLSSLTGAVTRFGPRPPGKTATPSTHPFSPCN